MFIRWNVQRLAGMIGLAALLGLLGPGCQSKNQQLIDNAPPVTRGFESATGQAVRFAVLPDAIVSLHPTQTELLFEISAQHKLKARSATSLRPPQALELPGVPMQPRLALDSLLRLGPDCILTTQEQFGDNLDSLRRVLARKGVPVLVQRYQQLADLPRNIRQLGRLTQRPDSAEALAGAMEQFFALMQDSMRQYTPKRSVVLVSFEPLTAVAGGHFMNDLLARGGARNALDSLDQAFVRLSARELGRLQPEAIFVPAGSDDKIKALVDRHKALQNLPAVRQGDLLGIELQKFLQPSSQSPQAIVEIAASLHPGAPVAANFKRAFGRKLYFY
jgi:ABC-type Fe3+-hydroxamate transport system substrate-binding protein